MHLHERMLFALTDMCTVTDTHDTLSPVVRGLPTDGQNYNQIKSVLWHHSSILAVVAQMGFEGRDSIRSCTGLKPNINIVWTTNSLCQTNRSHIACGSYPANMPNPPSRRNKTQAHKLLLRPAHHFHHSDWNIQLCSVHATAVRFYVP